MTALLEALIGYVFYELEPEERNMNSVMTLLLMLESQGDGPNSVSQLDLLFDDLSINKPNSFAAKQYKLYKMAPGKTAQSINVSLGLRMSAFNIPSIANICADDTIDLRELGSEKKWRSLLLRPTQQLLTISWRQLCSSSAFKFWWILQTIARISACHGICGSSWMNFRTSA